MGGEGGGGGVLHRSYAVSAPADRDASRLNYSRCIYEGVVGGSSYCTVAEGRGDNRGNGSGYLRINMGCWGIGLGGGR